MQLGPDCRIYMTSPNSTFYLNVIDKPNEKGQACNFVPRGLQLPHYQYISIPSFPHYRLGTDSPICDPDIVAPIMLPSSIYNFTNSLSYRSVPNPATHYLNIENVEGFGKNAEWELRNINGQIVQKAQLSQEEFSQRIELNEQLSGIYFQTVREEGQLIWRARVVIL